MSGRPPDPTPPSGPSSSFRPLLPAQSQSRGPDFPQRHFGFKRKRQAAACEPCREHKTKCDGSRPSCNACLRRGTECRFEAEPKETHVQALKRKFDSLQGEASSLQQVYDLLRTRPEAEALSIFHKIRDGESHESILQFVHHGDLLLNLSLTTSSSTDATASPRTNSFPSTSAGETVASSTLSDEQMSPAPSSSDRPLRGSVSSAASTQGYTSQDATQSASASRRPSTAPQTDRQLECESAVPVVEKARPSLWETTVMTTDS